jgi:hypothetical protein
MFERQFTDSELARAIHLLVVRAEIALDLPSDETAGFCGRLRRVLAAAAPPGRLDAAMYRAIFGIWRAFDKLRLQWAQDRLAKEKA